MKDLFDALILGIVEGLTEFLPISSTGHLILAGDLLDFDHPGRDVFYVAIQTGAMLAVIWEYRARFGRMLTGLHRDAAARRFALNLVIAFLPAAVLGLAFGGAIKQHLFHAVPVAAAFILGGAIILWVERSRQQARVEQVDDVTWKDALKVGLAQVYYQQGKGGPAVVVVEDLLKRPDTPPAAVLLHARILYKAGEVDRAVRQYKEAVALDPGLADPEFAGRLGIGADEESEVIDGRLRAADGDGGSAPTEVERPKVTFADVGGMDGGG